MFPMGDCVCDLDITLSNGGWVIVTYIWPSETDLL